ncbi:MAG: homocysteine S-methyltransferase [Gemmatimonadetes bacterium]|nr:homocysteine S-methyltransferase [Gemmatimonadota bacterium]
MSVGPDPIRPFLDHHGCVILDGGLATALEARGYVLDDRLWSAALLRDAPDAILAVHRAYLDAGADVVTTASYQASIPGFVQWGLTDAEATDLLLRSSKLALAARDRYVTHRDPADSRPPPLVAASVGPYGAYLADGSEYDGRYEGVSRSDLEDFHARRLEILAGSGVDLLACETVPSLVEAEVLVTLLSRLSLTVPAWLSVSCADEGRLHDGTPVEDVAALASTTERVVAVGVNCTAPRHLRDLVQRIRTVYDGHVVVYPNSGESYDPETGTWSDGADGASAVDDGWLRGVLEARAVGADVVGGCCRVGPDGIAELRRRMMA